MFYRYHYSTSESRQPFHGNRYELAKLLKANPNLKAVYGGPGCFVVEGNSSGTIYEYPEKISCTYIRSITPDKEFIRKRYGKSCVTEKDYENLVHELNAGELSFDELAVS